jgi:polyribonucleotide nucleotidyltransferase
LSVLGRALEQARQGRLQILKSMLAVIDRPRAMISAHAPRIIRTKIDSEKIGLVIGPSGKQIRKIQEETGASVAIEEDGVISIYCNREQGARRALEIIQGLTANPEVGRIYRGKVTSIKDFGCFVEILPNQEGLVHISELAEGFVNNVRDVVSEGAEIQVKVLAVDEQGRVKLSKKAADLELSGAKS